VSARTCPVLARTANAAPKAESISFIGGGESE
jgi:hypothetical protein